MARKISRRQYRKRKLEAYHLLKLLYYFIRHNPDNISFERIRGNVMGYYDFETQEITLDYRKEVIPTLIHEFIHHMHPTWCETKVLSKESQIMAVMSPRQCRNIVKKLAYCF